jgi:hypothetical protein
VKGAHRKSGIGEVRSSRQQEPQSPESRYRVGDNHGQVLKAVKGLERTCGLGRVFIRDSTQGSKEPLQLSRKGERGWVKPRITHLLQSMEVPTEIYPGGSLVPVLFRKATPSLQLTRGTCTCQFNIQRAQLPPGASHAELRRRMTGE